VCFRWEGFETLAEDLGLEIVPTKYPFLATLEGKASGAGSEAVEAGAEAK
jgi:hypothetical protein